MKKKTKEEIQKEWDHIHWIKQIVFGFGIPDESAVDYWNDRKRLQEEFNNI